MRANLASNEGRDIFFAFVISFFEDRDKIINDDVLPDIALEYLEAIDPFLVEGGIFKYFLEQFFIVFETI